MMEYTGVNFTPADMLDYDGGRGYVDPNTGYGDIYVGDAMTNDSYASAVDRFSVVGDGYSAAGESFATAGDFTNVEEEQYEGEGDYRERNVILTDGSDRFGVSTTAFDLKEELIWSGNQGGHVTSYLSSDMMKYTSFQVHATEEIRDLQTIEPGVLALTPTSLNMRTREGMIVFKNSANEFNNLQCLLPLRMSKSENICLIGGHQESMIEFDLESQKIIQKRDVGANGCVILREHPRFICYGDSTGSIFLHDPRTLKQEHSFQAHTGTLSDFDAQANYIITCGFSDRLGQMIADQFVMVYDLRMMKMALPLRAMVSPYFLRIMPNMSPCFAAVSLLGQWVSMDASQPESQIVALNYQLNCSPDSVVTSFDISTSSQALVFGDSHGSLHLFTNKSKPNFNNFSRETEIPHSEHHKSIPITDITTPLSQIEVFLSDEPLLSDWPIEFMQNSYYPSPRVDPAILQAMRMAGPVGYAPNTTNLKRNQMPYSLNENGRACHKSKLGDDAMMKKDEGPVVHVPRRYRKLELKYSKMGLDEFDYDLYNRTSFPGLDMSLPNSYSNAMIQMFYYIQPLRAIMLSHLCDREFCLACELGFLFHMQDISYGHGIPCQSANFLRAFRTIPEASAMGLTISDQDLRSRINFASKIQSWNCFVLQQIHSETMEGRQSRADRHSESSNLSDGPTWESRNSQGTPPAENEKLESSPISDLFGARTVSINTCTRCKNVNEKEGMTLTVNLSFHESAVELSKGPVPFSTVVQSSLCLDQVTQAWCDSCSKFQPVQQSRRYKSLPTIISMNCGLDSPQDLKFWNNQHEYLLTELHQKLKDEASAKKDEVGKEEEEKHKAGSPYKRAETAGKNTNVGSPARFPGKVRPCRYGVACVRMGCRFWHPAKDVENSNSDVLSLLEQTMDYSWIPLAMRLHLDTETGAVTVTNVTKDEFATSCDNETGIIYELVGVTSHVSDPKFPDKNNLTGCIKVGPSYHLRASVSPVSHWYLFNDISIQPVSCEESVWFPTNWKHPCVLFWIKKNIPTPQANLREVSPLTIEVFEKDRSMARGRKRITFTPLTVDEMPKEADIIAMDAEFVNLHQEEAEIRSDGTRTTIKPSQKSVARITCIRGSGPFKGTPFIDDYISTQEQVVDYLTQFSGIKPGDLDANYSSKHLTTLKSTYVKLRYLVDRGVKIIGHGLKNDFRVINMVVPQTQLIDTVHLFHMPHNRMVSLKFLAWHFLRVKIQSVTHDSIEDARTALDLYEKFQELLAEIEEYGLVGHDGGAMMPLLQELYDAGKKMNWKVPGEDDGE